MEKEVEQPALLLEQREVSEERGGSQAEECSFVFSVHVQDEVEQA